MIAWNLCRRATQNWMLSIWINNKGFFGTGSWQLRLCVLILHYSIHVQRQWRESPVEAQLHRRSVGQHPAVPRWLLARPWRSLLWATPGSLTGPVMVARREGSRSVHFLSLSVPHFLTMVDFFSAISCFFFLSHLKKLFFFIFYFPSILIIVCFLGTKPTLSPH